MIPTLQSIVRSVVRPLLLAVVATAAIGPLSLRAETSVAPETNPPGDIPDKQVFITYDAPQGFAIKVPEGRARQDAANGAVFSDVDGQIWIQVSDTETEPTPASVARDQAETLSKLGHAVEIKAITPVKLAAGQAIRIVFTSNSEPDAITGKQVREENETYLFFKADKLVSIDLSAPLGADNADRWRLISSSFRWK